MDNQPSSDAAKMAADIRRYRGEPPTSAVEMPEQGAAPLVGTGSMVGLPRRPWVASQQYSMRFILSADNEILVRADHLPIEILRAMAEAANTWQPNVKDEPRGK